MFEIIKTATYEEAEKKYGKGVGKKRLARMLTILAENPTYGPKIKKIAGQDFLYRYRIAEYRIFYEVLENEVKIIMLTIKPRGDAY